MRLAVLGILLCLLIAGSLQVAGAERASGGSNDDSGTSSPLIIVTEDAEVGPPACRPYQLAVRLVRFMDALAAVDRRALGRFWGNDFKWFSITTGPGQGFAAYSPERGVKYLRKRGGLDLRLTGVVIYLQGGVGARVGVGYSGFWLPPGGPSELPLHGKGEVSCDSPRIPVWSTAVRPDLPFGPPCPPPPEPPPDGVETLIACTS